jgi:hypothetical protein
MWLRLCKYVTSIVLPITMLLFLGCGGGGVSTPPPTYTISGKVVPPVGSTAGVQGIIVNLVSSTNGATIASDTIKDDGSYTLTAPNGTYTIQSVNSAGSAYGIEQSVTIGSVAIILDITAFPVFTVTGNVSLNGSGFPSVTVTLYKTYFSIYSIDNLYGTSTPTLQPNGTVTKTAAPGGVYSFTGVRSGSYTILSSQSGYLFNPDITNAKVISITDNGNLYVYDPTATHNSVTDDQSIIYNSGPTAITGNTVPLQNFTASLPGGVHQP